MFREKRRQNYEIVRISFVFRSFLRFKWELLSMCWWKIKSKPHTDTYTHTHTNYLQAYFVVSVRTFFRVYHENETRKWKTTVLHTNRRHPDDCFLLAAFSFISELNQFSLNSLLQPQLSNHCLLLLRSPRGGWRGGGFFIYFIIMCKYVYVYVCVCCEIYLCPCL